MFSEEQLQAIEKGARKTKNQGELAILDYVTDHLTEFSTFTLVHLNVLKYCAEECKRQKSGELSVYWMVKAWDYAHQRFNGQEYPSINLNLIEHLGTLVEPYKNQKGFRLLRIGVQTREGWIEKAPWDRVPFALEHLLESYYSGSLWGGDQVNALSKRAEDEFYYEYENIHPFVDGNGRTGVILYNYLLGRLHDPILPPDFWKDDD